MCKIFVGICMVLILSWLPLYAQDNLQASPLAQAYELNKSGQYDQAAEIYQNQLQLTGPSADLYYNLGTVYLNAQRIADARIALEKAHRMEPGNKQIQKQLEVLKSKIEPKIDALPAFLLYQWFIRIRNIMNSTGWGLGLIVSAYLTLIWLVFRRAGRFSHFPSWISLVLMVGLGMMCILYFSSNQYQLKHFSVLMVDHPLYIAPDSLSQVLIPLGKGSKAEVIDSLGQWYKVILENNDQGWLPKSGLQNF